MDKQLTVTAAQTRIDHEGETDECVRVYKSSPECIAIQIRTFGPVAASGQGKERSAYSHAELNSSQLDKLIGALQQARAEL